MTEEEFRADLETLYIPRTTDADFSQAPVPFCSNDMITNKAGIAEGQMGFVTHDVELLTGRKLLEVYDLLNQVMYGKTKYVAGKIWCNTQIFLG